MLAMCWAYQPSVMWEKFSLEKMLLRSEKGNVKELNEVEAGKGDEAGTKDR